MKYLYIWLAVINITAFVMAGVDKHKAKAHKWRIRESTLIASAILGGSVGLLLGMAVFHHKTKHPKFTVGVPVILMIQVIAAVWYFFLR
jgi:uncharacterized membrane protein YsdA (DUF1294 family)